MAAVGAQSRASDDVGSWRSSPYVSGELHYHIRYCAQYSSGLADVIARRQNVTDAMLVDWATGRSCEFQYLMNCMNVIRADFDDVDRRITS